MFRGLNCLQKRERQGASLTGREVELKFRCEARDLDAVLAAAPGEGLQTRDLVSTYFDTPDGALSGRHMSLRLRESAGGAVVQTFKAGQGLTRQELEWPAPQGLDLGHPKLRAVLKAPLRKALAEAFTVTISRRQRTFDYKGAQIELALDEGEARRGDQRRAICEVELELKSGSSAALFDLARELSRVAPLRLSFLGKASQGQMLVQQAPSFSRDTDLALTRDTSPGEAFQVLARRAFVDLTLHAEAYSESGHGRALHSLRVSTRRLKSYLATFSPLQDETAASAVRKHLNWLLQVSAEARNLDVFAETYLQSDPSGPLAQAVKAASASAHARTRAALASGRLRQLLLDLAAWVETDAWQGRSDQAAGALKQRLRPFARRVLNQSLKRLARHAKDLRALDPEARHLVRLKAKRLRYVLEAFIPLFASGHATRYLTTLRAIQTDLGDLNDAAAAVPLVQGLNLGDGETLALQGIAARTTALEAGLATTNRKLRRLLDQAPPWAT
ncbi:MAG: hypothetical protein CFE28_01805 [Alphaproteobacteria bacterium PA2]|nr:MAG: hypothetical protein CFE28_01805 [Alphaproteobacteria bacterium PA2]